MVVHERVLVHATEDVTAGDVVADLERRRVEVPVDVSVEGLGVDSTWR